LLTWLDTDSHFPNVAKALHEPNGLLAAGAELSPERLLTAYRAGIFPWFSPGDPILWWSPDPRMVLIPERFKLSRSLAKTLRNTRYEVRFDHAYEQVMRACAAPREADSGTWISAEMVATYCELHRRGYAHSVEVWQEGELVGGLYGVALGRMFFGESMFSAIPNGSKIALAYLSRQLSRWQFGMIDCQMHTPHLASLGAQLMARDEFISNLQDLVNCAPITHWRFDPDLFT
jgi:leucyl/phenylalanyl-tRNA--protein transferase